MVPEGWDRYGLLGSVSLFCFVFVVVVGLLIVVGLFPVCPFTYALLIFPQSAITNSSLKLLYCVKEFSSELICSEELELGRFQCTDRGKTSHRKDTRNRQE